MCRRCRRQWQSSFSVPRRPLPRLKVYPRRPRLAVLAHAGAARQGVSLLRLRSGPRAMGVALAEFNEFDQHVVGRFGIEEGDARICVPEAGGLLETLAPPSR